MEASDGEELVRDDEENELVPPPNGGLNELRNIGQEDNMQGQVSALPPCETSLHGSQVSSER